MVRGRHKSGDVDHRSGPGSTVEGFGEKPSDFPCLALTRMTSSMVIGLMQSHPHLLAEPEERRPQQTDGYEKEEARSIFMPQVQKRAAE